MQKNDDDLLSYTPSNQQNWTSITWEMVYQPML